MVRSSLHGEPAVAAPAPAAAGGALAGSWAGLCLQQLVYMLVVLLGSAGCLLVMALGFCSKAGVLQGTARCSDSYSNWLS